MLSRIDRIKAINGDYAVNTRKDGHLADIRYELEKHFPDSLGYEPNALRNGKTQEIVVIQDTKNYQKKKIKSRPSESFDKGDVWDCYNEKYLVVEIDPNKQVETSGVIQQCNYILPFQTDSSEIYYEPCIVDDKTTLDTGEKEGKIISIPDTRRVVRVQYNERTAKLHEEKRIFIDMPFEDANVYKITEINRVTEMQGGKGIWVLKCDEDHLNKDTDRSDLLIANYIAPDDTAPDPDPSPADYECEIIYSGTPEIKVGGSAKTFTAKFYDVDDNQFFYVEPIWNINDNYGGAVQIKDQFDNKIKIQVASVSGLVGKSFELTLRDVDGLYEAKLEVRMVSLY